MRVAQIVAASALALGVVSGAIASSRSEPAAVPAADAPASTTPSRMSAMANGYLSQGAAPNSLLLNLAPPGSGSAAKARDEEAAKAAIALRDTPRWHQAVIDADLFSPKSTGIFSCAAGVLIGPDSTPKLNALMRRMAPDLALAVYPTKKKYMRPRPFTENAEPTCTPQDEKMLRADGSYPSGHSALGWGWGLVLAEVVPDRAAELVARGRAFGDSRRICNVHWLSDVEEGRVVATAVVARLHAEPAFRADVEAARAEIDAIRAKAIMPDCALENAALANN